MSSSYKNSPVFLRAISLNKRQKKDSDFQHIKPKTAFILSTGRTGTKFLAEYLNSFEDVKAVHEPRPSRRLRFWTMAYLQGKTDDEAMRTVLHKFRSGFFDSVSEGAYVESNNFMAGFANALRAEFNDPLIIHVVRDPRTYVKSAMNKGADSGLKGFANKAVPYAHLKMGEGEEKVLRRTATYWKLVNECIEKAGKNYPNYHLFRFEDLFDQQSGELKKLTDIFGLKPGKTKFQSGKKINKAHLNVMPSWQKWPPSSCKIINEICGAQMEKYGYGGEKEWEDKIKGQAS